MTTTRATAATTLIGVVLFLCGFGIGRVPHVEDTPLLVVVGVACMAGICSLIVLVVSAYERGEG